MTRPPALGTVNGFSVCSAKFGRTAFTFNGTVRGLTDAAVAAGATVGSRLSANFGVGASDCTMTAAPHDSRCGGVWAVKTDTL